MLFHVIESSSTGYILHHHFIYAELEELYLDNSKTFDCFFHYCEVALPHLSAILFLSAILSYPILPHLSAIPYEIADR